jgi:hypothetical protein
VGHSDTASGPRALLWQDGLGMPDLNDLLDPSDPLSSMVSLTAATAINSLGQTADVGSIMAPRTTLC